MKDFTLDGNKAANATAKDVLVIRAWRSTVDNVSIYNAKRHGLVVTSISRNGTPFAANKTQVNGRISNVYVSNSGGHGIYVQDKDGATEYNTVTDWNLVDNWVASSGLDAIHLENAAGWVIERNHVYGVGGSGIWAHRLFGSSVSDNYVEDFGSTGYGIGVTVNGDGASVIQGNRVFRNQGTGTKFIAVTNVNSRNWRPRRLGQHTAGPNYRLHRRWAGLPARFERAEGDVEWEQRRQHLYAPRWGCASHGLLRTSRAVSLQQDPLCQECAGPRIRDMSVNPSTELPADPEHDPRASYAFEPDQVRRLTDRVISTTGTEVTVHSPISGQPLARIPQSSEDDVREAYARARRAQKEWRRVSLDDRSKMMLRLHDLVLDRQDEIMDLICWESGKARKHAFDEPLHIALTARYYARTAHKHLDSTRRAGVIPGLTHAEVNHLPKGVVGIISPWNYPFTMALCDGLPALMAGNAVVTKPDAQTMLSALLGAELLEQAGFPAGLWNVVAGPGRELGTPMINRSDYICFTGSTATGKIIAKQCAERLIGCSLELGGKNPILILRDADLERAAEGAVRACFSNAGQLCVSTERMFVADQVYDRFKEKFVAHTKAMALRPGIEWGSDMGSLISQDQLDTVVAHVDDAVAKGARVLAGGKARPDLGPFYYEPTILEGVTPDMVCFGQETFGPVISLYRFHDEADAVSRANAGDYGLNASIYTRDAKRGREIARRIKCGTVNVNEAFGATFASIDAPMGGMRESGQGRRQGGEGILRYTETQSVASQALLRFSPMFGMSDANYAKVMTVSLRVMKKLGRA